MSFTGAEIAAVCGLVGLAGFVDAIAGGGGLISLPAYLAVGLPPHAALATNKFSSCLGTGVAVWRYARAGTLRTSVGLWSAGGALLGAMGGGKLALWLAPQTLHTLIIVLLPCVLVFLLLRDRLLRPPNALPLGAARAVALKSLAIGAVIGTYDGFFGPGTGTLLTVAFAGLLGMDLLCASANARLSNLASNLGSLGVFWIEGQVIFPLALFAAAAGIVGNLLGARLALRKGARIIKPLLVGVLIWLMAEVIRRRFA